MHEVVGITFAKNGRVYYFSTNNIKLTKNQSVIAETERGLQYGFVCIEPKIEKEENLMIPLKNVLRISTSEDEKQYQRNLKDSEKALQDAKRLSRELNLKMSFINASFTLNRTQLLFNFVAEERIDFRELAKKLAQIYKTRIELRQIGVRDKAKEIGGLGPCGRFLCCNLFLTDFDSVSINMAKNQYLALNPTKINGVCGRLLCCLNYEDQLYTELKKGMPEVGIIAQTPSGMGKVISVDLFKRKYKVELKNKEIVELVVDESNGKIK